MVGLHLSLAQPNLLFRLLRCVHLWKHPLSTTASYCYVLPLHCGKLTQMPWLVVIFCYQASRLFGLTLNIKFSLKMVSGHSLLRLGMWQCWPLLYGWLFTVGVTVSPQPLAGWGCGNCELSLWARLLLKSWALRVLRLRFFFTRACWLAFWISLIPLLN